MKNTTKSLGTVALALFSFFFFYTDSREWILSGVLSLVILLLGLALAFGEGKIFPDWKADTVFCGLVGILLAFALARTPALVLQELGWSTFGLFFYFVALPFGWSIGVAFSQKPGLAVFGGGGSGGGFSLTGALGAETSKTREKILDTSVVIDGRVLDIADTHFLDGPLILPNFVLREIQLISDSPDPIKRARGRRGLDMLKKLQTKGSIEVKITYTDYSDTREVDQKLVKLARDTGGSIVTNDFNLNKVAELQGVKVLNLNNLANALKPVVLPGEEFPITVIKEGKDENQGIGYLEDGTMVVIENGGYLVGKEIRVAVTSIIQTAAGKMIFTKVQNAQGNSNR